MTMKRLLCCVALMATLQATAKVVVRQTTPQTAYAASRLKTIGSRFNIVVDVAGSGTSEGFTITRKGGTIAIVGNDGPGAIYGANRLLELWAADSMLTTLTRVADEPRMKLRGACVGLQKTEYLPGHRVYEYPYTPENFPWFYDRELWLRYLDMLAENNMNTVYLWNGHPFASLVKLDDYPFAPEVDDKTMALNQQMFSFLVDEADRRGIRLVQMFYNIILSKPFADHYGLKTQDRNRPITPLISDYTRKSIAAFVEQYPKVGFLVCLGEAMSGVDTDIEWMTKTIIPGIRDGLKASGRNDTPPIILRSHDTDGPAVLKAALPLYPNIYTMSKYTGESLTTYEPRGPWGETHRRLAAAAPIHIDNVHILANLEPWRWASPTFTQKAVKAMHSVHHAGGLHLYPQASYWDWPYTADRLPGGKRLLQIDRDWMWYKAWGRYAWNSDRDSLAETSYWARQLAHYYGCSESSGRSIAMALDHAGEIAPMLLRRFGITEGNRQTLLLGMKMSQLVNPYKYNIYPGFYESCGPKGEKLIDYTEREWKHLSHEGELPLDVAGTCTVLGNNAAIALYLTEPTVTKHVEEYRRLHNDISCYQAFANYFNLWVQAAHEVLLYRWSKDLAHLDSAVPLMESALDSYRTLVGLTDSTYLYANSMQTAQRRIPVGGDNGRMKTWREMLPVYEAELSALKANLARLRQPAKPVATPPSPATPEAVDVVLTSSVGSHAPASSRQSVGSGFPAATTPLIKGALLFEGRSDTPVDTVAPELSHLSALVLNRDTTRIVGTTLAFTTDKEVKLLVGFFQDDDPKWAKAPKLETDATGNEYGQAEPLLANAVCLRQMPTVNIHAYHFKPGSHTISLPKGIILVAGFTTSDIRPRDAQLQGAGDEVDWLFSN